MEKHEKSSRTIVALALLIGLVIGGGLGYFLIPPKVVEVEKMVGADEETVKALQNQVASLKDEAKAKQEEINTLQQQVKDLESQIEALTSTTTSPSTEETEITGTVTLTPETLEVKHKLISSGGSGRSAVVEIQIKNTGSETLLYPSFRVTVLSEDKDGNVLGQTGFHIGRQDSRVVGGPGGPLAPKQTMTWGIKLFPSDEVKSYEIEVEPTTK